MGIMEKVFHMTRHPLITQKILTAIENPVKSVSDKESILLNHIIVPGYILCVGLAMAFITWLVERNSSI